MTSSLYQWVTNTAAASSTDPDTITAIEQQHEEKEKEKEKARCEWDFHLATVISPATPREASDILGVVEFDPSDQLLATGGIARKIRIYTLTSLLRGEDDDDEGGGATPRFTDHRSACSYYICTPAKLSSLRWKPDTGSGVIGSADYDGVITEYDLEKHVPVFERDEHSGRRVWSLDYSRSTHQLGASGSDDGTTQLWDPRTSAGCATLSPGKTRSPVCSVEFDPLGGLVIGLGCADRRAYVYDLRMTSGPISVFHGHRRTVTYVRFVGDGRAVTASIDGCLKMWEWDTAEGNEVRTYEGHLNTRSFVGLSAWRSGGLLGCGSESNEVYVYDMRWGEPIAVQGFAPRDESEFASSVCWRQAAEDECTLVAGGSNGVLQVSVGKRKPFSKT